MPGAYKCVSVNILCQLAVSNTLVVLAPQDLLGAGRPLVSQLIEARGALLSMSTASLEQQLRGLDIALGWVGGCWVLLVWYSGQLRPATKASHVLWCLSGLSLLQMQL
jgi:hypothetical protein